MEPQEHIEDEQVSPEYLQGYNNAFVVGTYEPELLNDITPDVNTESMYFQGFFDGKTQWQQEQDMTIFQELQAIHAKQYENQQNRER